MKQLPFTKRKPITRTANQILKTPKSVNPNVRLDLSGSGGSDIEFTEKTAKGLAKEGEKLAKNEEKYVLGDKSCLESNRIVSTWAAIQVVETSQHSIAFMRSDDSELHVFVFLLQQPFS